MLRRLLDRSARDFEKGGRFARFHPLYEAADTILYTPAATTTGPSHVRDGLDMKRMMWLVVVALAGPVAMAFYNTGYQANLAIQAGALPLDNWQTDAMRALDMPFGPEVFLSCVVHGGLYFLPVLLVTFMVGGLWETLFALVRGHEINEGFLVTGMLIPLTLPPAIPLWQVALGTSFGVVIGKEIFGGTGMNILNPALTARAFLFFAYPAEISGNVWVAAAGGGAVPDGFTGATALAAASASGLAGFEGLSFWDAFAGFVPGSMGETSALACLAGAVLLIATGIGSWRIMLGVTIGTILTAWGLNAIGSSTNPFFEVPFWWHFVLGGWAFGTVYMATDPVTATHTDTGRWIYGLLIGLLTVLIRVVNPAYPEGMMLAILFMNIFAPAIDHFIVRANIRRRRARGAA
ncbi:NADH:ubiquinone reductase (Na(+)-transporting) subunit B [Luteitalea sp.]|uniref:NADH:ubiquinone reductase (Na(+)-transporting) subunit B n=1 Tax=Luteitalea sp. TaxID=2004800 RepID=UPI0025BCC09D|nr:NADH:ubiquinone reductase (Na(+)-transporting) subunit B [Luteitalea sp.]